MTLFDFIQQCRLAVIERPCPRNTPTVWLLVQSRSGLGTMRRTFRALDGGTMSLDSWLDLISQRLTTDTSLFVPRPGRVLEQFRPVMVAGPYLPIGLAVILPSRRLPVLEAALSEGPAAELPWLDTVNMGVGVRAFPRDHSIAASLLALAQRALIATWN